MKVLTNVINIILVSCIICIATMQGDNNTEIKCGDAYCNYSHGNCVEENGVFECLCDPEFYSFPDDNRSKCDYTRKSRFRALILELILTYGAGHFYASNYKFAIPKFLFFIFAYYAFILLRAISKGNQSNKKFSKAIKISAIIVVVLMLAWQITDLVLFGLNYHTDGNGKEMI